MEDYLKLISPDYGHDSLGAEWIYIKSIDKDILSPFAYKVISNYKKQM